MVGVAVDCIDRVGEQRRSTETAYEISFVDVVDVSGHWSWRNGLGTPKLYIADDKAVIKEMAYGYIDGDQAECLRCNHQVEDAASVVRHVEVGEVLHVMQQSQLIE